MTEQLFEQLAQSVIDGDDNESKDLTNKLLGENIPAKQILNDGLMKGMDVVGRRFRDNEIFVPEVLVSARAMKKAMDVLKPELINSGDKMSGVVMLGTVEGDIHDIGKNLVSILLQGAGFDIIDLGVSVSKQTFIDKIEEHHPDILGLTAMLTTTMHNMEPIITEIQKSEFSVKTIIGGAPINTAFANEIGADAFGKNASDAVNKVKALMGDLEQETVS